MRGSAMDAMVEDAGQPGWRKRRRAILAGSIGVVALLVSTLWIERRELAGDVIDRRLAAAGVPAGYRILSLGPTMQVIEDVRIGEAARPDFTARRVVLRWRYRLGVPGLAGIEVEGGRLRAAWRDGRLSLGAIDRLVPQSGGGRTALPDLDATLHDVTMALATPFGPIDASIDGVGNLARDFHGIVRATGSPSTAAGCAARGNRAWLTVRTADHAPYVAGPIEIGSVSCHSLRLDPARATIDLRLSRALDAVNGTIDIAGFGGARGNMTFGGLRGRIGIAAHGEVTGETALTLSDVRTPPATLRSVSVTGRYRYGAAGTAFDGRVALRALATAPSIGARITPTVRAMGATPLGPIAARFGKVAGLLASGSDIDAPVSLAFGRRTLLSVDRATIRAGKATQAIVSARIAGDGTAWRASGRIGGADIPHLAVEIAKVGAQAPIEALIRSEPYRSGAAMVALTPVRIRADRGGTRFETIATLDGPLGSGRIEGLTLPLAGTIDRAGGIMVGGGCIRMQYRRVRVAALALDPAVVALCGAPLLSKTPRGALHIAATGRDLVLTGHSGAAPLVLRAATLRLTEAGFVGTDVAARIGAADDPTHVEIRSLDGRLLSGSFEGRFAEAAGAIGHVPLALSGASGRWRLEGGALHLAGALRVADRAAAARFLPLAAQEVTLDLTDGRIAAAGTLRSSPGNAPVAHVMLHHDLASGTGNALLDVPGIAFARGALQPEMLTPLTLGVIANVTGTVRGSGRIDWSPAGTTSNGTFTTDRLDLAAAFGPVAGIAGTIRFTDLLGLVTAPHQEARIAEINPGVAVGDGVAHYRLIGDNRVRIEDARWPFAGGTLVLDPATLDFGQTAERRLTFRVAGLDAAAFIQQLDFPNISATGTFDGRLPMVFDQAGGRIEDGALTARGPGTLAYVGELSNAQLGTMGKLAFDALKAIRYSGLDIALGGSLDGEIVTRVRFDGVRQATGDKGLVARMIRNLPFRFNIRIQAPFRGLVGSARSYANPALLLQSAKPPDPVQPPESAPMR